ncbi:MAG: hypothetical protein WBD20_25460, partial [Pirellulaceae bacterium]
RTEKRESKVSVASGKAQVPGSVRASFDVDTKKPPTSSPSVEQLRFALEDVRFYSPRGDHVHQNIAAKQLRLRQPVVLLSDDETLSPFLQQLIRPETLVVQRKR